MREKEEETEALIKKKGEFAGEHGHTMSDIYNTSAHIGANLISSESAISSIRRGKRWVGFSDFV